MISPTEPKVNAILAGMDARTREGMGTSRHEHEVITIRNAHWHRWIMMPQHRFCSGSSGSVGARPCQAHVPASFTLGWPLFKFIATDCIGSRIGGEQVLSQTVCRPVG